MTLKKSQSSGPEADTLILGLERTIGQVARKVALRIAEGENEDVVVDAPDLSELLGPERFVREEARRQLPPGVASGLDSHRRRGPVR